MHPTINIAVRAARKAGTVIRKAFERPDYDIEKKAANDYVTHVDRAAEAVIIDIIQNAFPEDDIISEEAGFIEGAKARTWLIDPLDGTANFIHGIPHAAVSIACIENGHVQHAIVYDPFREELFRATKGEGAALNDKRIKIPSERLELNRCILATGLPFKKRKLTELSLQQIKHVFSKVHDIRRHGAAALDLAYVAAGRFDGYWEMGLKPWDLAAGSLIAKEAGAFISDLDSGSDYLKTGNVLCTNRTIFAEIMPLLEKAKQI